ncbi:MAG: Asp-tRNA(Asn)/Glu-tRNA(Gln) amidotransferase subunit GatC [Patescibacteria group bacterium]
MISKEEIKKLADLARIDIEEKEAESLSGEMDAILEYVKMVNEFQVEEPSPNLGKGDALARGEVVNVLREDQDPTNSETYSKELIAEFPKSDKNYLKVKKIL